MRTISIGAQGFEDLQLNEYFYIDKTSFIQEWYDGFTFGESRDIYNPWSITNFLKNRQF